MADSAPRPEVTVGVPQRQSFGKACNQCYKSKSRCVTKPGDGGCERCFRLKKACQTTESARQRPPPRSRVAVLEHKIDSLLSMMRPTAGADEQPRRLEQISRIGSNNASSSRDSGSSSATQPGMPSSHSSPDLWPSFQEPSLTEAERCLDIFRSRVLPNFAFLHLPSNLSARKLSNDRPLLYRVIITLALSTTQGKMPRREELSQYLAQSALLQQDTNVDLLMALLTYIAWSNDPFYDRGSTLSRLMMLATSLVSELRLDRTPAPDTTMLAVLTPGFGNTVQETGDMLSADIFEKPRAALACFFLGSVVSSYFAQVSVMQWTPTLEENLNAIAANQSCPSDAAFAFQVRLQLIAQRAAHLKDQEVERARVAMPMVPSTLPTLLYMKTLQDQLQRQRTLVPPALQQEEILMAHIHYVEFCINEAVLPPDPNAPYPVALASESTSSELPGFARLECLWRCINAIKAWFDTFLTTPPAKAPSLPFFVWSQLIRCIIVFKRLAMLQDPAWDRQAVWSTVDLPKILERLTELSDQASQIADEQSDEDLFRKFSRIMRISRGVIWRLGPQPVEEEDSQWLADSASGSNHAGGNGLGMTQMGDPHILDFGNDRWMEEIFGLTGSL